MKTLKKFLEKNGACRDGFDFAKDLTLEQFLNTCERGDWILWLFTGMNLDSLRELTLAKAHCANTVRKLMKDERSIKAIDVAIAFGEGRATREELDGAADDAAYVADAGAAAAYVAARAGATADADAAAYYAAYAAADAAAAGAAAWTAAAAAADAAAYVAARADAAAARKENQKQTAEICRKYLPLQIWDQSKI